MNDYTVHRQLKNTLMGTASYGVGTYLLPNGQLSQIDIFIKSFSKQCIKEGKTLSGLKVNENPKIELKIQAQLSSNNIPFVVRLYDVKDGGEYIIALMEFCERGELFSIVQNGGKSFTDTHAKTYFIQLLLGFKGIHSLNIAHRDISLENLLINKEYTLLIADYGKGTNNKGKEKDSKCGMKTCLSIDCGTLIDGYVRDGCAVGKVRYMCPEIFSQISYKPILSDIWSCGVVLFVMLFQVFPWNIPHSSDPLFVLICSGRMNEVMKSWGRPAVSDDLIDLFGKIFCSEDKRENCSSLLKHSYLRETWENNHIYANQTQPSQRNNNNSLEEDNSMRAISATTTATSSSPSSSSSSSHLYPHLAEEQLDSITIPPPIPL